MAVDGRRPLVTAEWWQTRRTTVATRLPLQATLPINPSSARKAAETSGFAFLGDGIHARVEDCSVRIKLRLKKHPDKKQKNK